MWGTILCGTACFPFGGYVGQRVVEPIAQHFGFCLQKDVTVVTSQPGATTMPQVVEETSQPGATETVQEMVSMSALENPLVGDPEEVTVIV